MASIESGTGRAGLATTCSYLEFNIDQGRLPSGVRILGDGFVGGKAIGLIFTAAACEFEDACISEYPELVRFPESTIVATGYYDSFIRENRLEAVVQAKCDSRLGKVEMAQRFIESPLPKQLTRELRHHLAIEKRPMAVRSSSFLEDNLKHSFAGIYQSFFIPNRGNDRARLQQLETAIKLVYLSTFGDNAKEYRARHNIKWREEKMGVLIQNLIGKAYPDHLYYPLLAGVGFSRNFYPWSDKISPEDGVVRVVMGLGTRAVGRYYARVFSPSAPMLRPEGGSVQDIVRYSQRDIDALDLETGAMQSPRVTDLKDTNDQLYKVTSELREKTYLMDAPNRLDGNEDLVLTFNPILDGDRVYPFVKTAKSLLKNLEQLFGVPIDMEFAVDLGGDDRFYIVQVRPLGGRAEHKPVRIPVTIPVEDVVLSSENVLGNGIKRGIRHIVYVPLEKYRFDKGYDIARRIGEINSGFKEGGGYILIGPGRWATSHPDLGVPVHYSEISHAEVIVECSHGDFTPELSYGTHFFGDMVVSKMIYIPLFLEKRDYLNRRFLESDRNSREKDGVRLIEVNEGLDVFVDGQSRTGIILRRRVPLKAGTGGSRRR